MLRGLTTVNFFADDVPAAVQWYSELLGIEPYFVRPEEGPAAYVEFRIGAYSDELGIMDRKYAAHPTAGPDRVGRLLARRRRRRGDRARAGRRGHGPRSDCRARSRLRHRIGRSTPSATSSA